MGKTTWKEGYILRGYKPARAGLRDKSIARSLGVEGRTFARWVERRPALKEALEEGRRDLGRREGGTSAYDGFKKFAYGTLPRAARRLWDEVDRIHSMPSGSDREAGKAALQAVLEGQGRRMRQHLLIHALVASNFVLTEACRMVGVTPHAVRQWARKDPAFASLVAGLHEAKKDFFEAALVELVARGDSAATIFACKTQLRDRGYDQKQGSREDQGEGAAHRIDELDLPPDVMRLVLAKLREKDRTRNTTGIDTIDRTHVER